MPTVELDPACTPQEIEARSFAIIDAEIPEPRPFSGGLWEVAGVACTPWAIRRSLRICA